MASICPRVLYCDESRTDGGGPFFLGALDCSPRRAEIIKAQLVGIRHGHGCTGEIKWTKVSAKMMPTYVAFADAFLKDRYARFHVMRVERTPAWSRWAGSWEERFFRTYYAFLRRVMSGYRRYDVHLDHMQAKRWRWEHLRRALGGAAVRDEYAAGRRLVPKLKAEDSKASDLLQLVDLLLGAIAANPEGAHKRAFRQHVLDSARDGGRVTQWTFSRDEGAT